MNDNIFAKYNNYVIKTCNYITTFQFKCMNVCTVNQINNYQIFNQLFNTDFTV